MLHGETQLYVKVSCFDGKKLLRLNLALHPAHSTLWKLEAFVNMSVID
jgi:hypothetical protein